MRKRWLEIASSDVEVILDVKHLEQRAFVAGSCLLVHLDSFSKEQLAQVIPYGSQVKLIGFSDNPNDAQGIELLLRGFKGYINTFVSASIFNELLLCVTRGDIWAGASIVQTMLKQMLNQPEMVETQVPDLEQYELSDRELEVVNVLIEGASNKEIGRTLDITERTVKAHVSSILRKTETSDRVSLILKLKNKNN